jgi:uncharacterized protein (DUF4415 family)
MPKDESTKRYTSDELAEMLRRGEDRTDWAKVDSLTDEELERLISEDDDERGFVPDWTSARLVMPERKSHINLRIDQDVLRFFKSQGPGYQTRMNAVLRSYMLAHQGKD